MKSSTTSDSGFQPKIPAFGRIFFVLLFLLPSAAFAQADAFIITVKTNNGPGSTSFTIPTTGSGYNYQVDWDNDGNYEQSGITGDVTHNYGTAGTYTIRIRGAFPRIYFNFNINRQKLLDISQWGDIAWASMQNAFDGCSNLNISATDVPDLSGVTNMSQMFRLCTALNSPANINTWNTAAVTNMSGMFYEASSFNQPIGNWNTAAVINMGSMFYRASSFNQPIGDWNTAAVTIMGEMFSYADAFNQPIGTWNTAAVTDMRDMFNSADAFNQPIGTWNTAAVTDMRSMFANTPSFNQPIGTWNTAAVTRMDNMFNQASSFNQPIGTWNTAAVINMSGMFLGAGSFNQPIGNWNTAAVTNMNGMFYNAISFNQPIGNWNTAAVTIMAAMFSGASSFNQPIGAWNTAAVINMGNMFYGASLFNQPIGNWNTAAVADMSYMFAEASAFNQPLGTWTLNASVDINQMLHNCGMDCSNYSATLIGWANNPATPSGRSLGAGGLQYGTNAAAARTALADARGWTIYGDTPSGTVCALPPQGDELIITVKTDNPGSTNSTSFRIPTIGIGYNYSVDWDNDGNYDETGLTSDAPHDFGTAGTYTIRIRGSFPRIFFGGSGSRQKLIDINQWGSTAWVSMERAFQGCTNLNISATDVPNLSGLTSMDQMFANCTSLNSPANIGDWNTATVTNMFAMFSGAVLFNQPIGNWNTSAVTNMASMFYQAGNFDQPIGNWNTAAVTDMTWMFNQAGAFNQPIGNWNTGAVTDMTGMFQGAGAFNQPIGDWNTAAVTNMASMFQSASAFNQPIGNWNTAEVTNMQRVFYLAGAFNQPIGNWNTGAVTDMMEMFKQATSFDQPIGNWNTASVTNMWGMFNEAPEFNQPIGNWNTASVTVMFRMFHDAIAFNQPLGNWNTAAVTDMAAMFYQATAFNQPLGTWQLNEAVKMFLMLDDCGMDCANYSATLIGWANNPATPSGRQLDATGLLYDANAVAAHTTLTDVKGWTIAGDAPASVTTADAGPNDILCSLMTTLAGNVPVIGTGTWTQVSGPGTANFADPNMPNTSVTVSAAGTYTMRWTIDAPCAASSDEVAITFTANPTAANAGPDQTDNATCGLTQVTLAANAPTVGTGAWSIVGGTGGSLGNASSPTSTFSGNAGATYTLRWTVSNPPCSPNTDEMVVTFNQNPTSANAGPDQTGNATCGQTIVTLAGNSPTVGIGAWSIVGGTGGSLGNASSPTSTFSGNAGATYTLRWTVTNAPCAASTDDMVVSFNQNPTFSACPPGVTVSTSSGCSATATYTATTANTTPASSVTYTFSGATSGSGSGTGSGSAFNLGTTTVNLTATNSCGTSSCFFLVIVQAPEANVQGNGMTIPDGDNTPGISDHTDFGQTTGASVQRTFTVQNSGSANLNVTGITLGGANANQFSVGALVPPSPVPPNGSATFTVTYAPSSAAIHNATLTLANGDCDESTYDFAIRGELTCTAPAFTACPSTQISLNTAPNTCSAIGTYTVAASGLPAPSLTYAFVGATAGSGNGTGSGSSFNKGITTVTVTATNPCGAPVCSFSIAVVDNQLPSITCPGSSTVNATTGQCAAVVNYSVSGSDNCSDWSLSRTSGLASGSLFPVGTTTVSWKNTDGAGNSSTCSFSVTVNDTQLPGITCPANITANAATGSCAATVNYATPTVSDNCSGVSAMHVNGGTSGSSFNKGVNTVQWKATDAANNTRTCSFSITVNDNQLPSITCPANLTANTGANTCAATVTFNNATATDNCTPPPTVAQTGGAASGSSFPKGLHTITFKATDGAGLTKTCTFRITVVDNVLPTITCPSNIVKNTDNNLCTSVTTYSVTGADNCTSVSVSRVSGLTSGSAFPRGVNTVTWRATDLAGNVTLCSFTVTVNDAQGPTITCPQNINVNTTTGQCNRVVNYTTPTYSDNCTGGSISLFSGLASGSVFPTGSSTVIWRAFDNSANSNTCSFMVTVTDNELPVITCPPAATVSGSGSPCGYPANQLSTPAATDNCAVTSLASDAPATLPAGATTITWTAGDATGNQKTCAYVVTVNCGTAGMMNDEIRMMNDAERESASFLTVPSGQALITHNSSLITHHLSLFPNPASDIVVITLSNQQINNKSNQQPSASNQQINNTSNQQIFIHDALGREVWRKTVAHDVEQLTLDLVAQGLKDGTYQVSWKTTNGLISKTLVLIKR